MSFRKSISFTAAFLLVSSFSLPAFAGGKAGKRFLEKTFQVAFVGRASNNSLDEERLVEVIEGGAESLQIPVPGVTVGEFLEELDFNTIVSPPGAPETDLEIATRGTFTTALGSLSWEARMLIVFLDVGDPDGIESATIAERGTITGGTGIYKGATGSIEIAGSLSGCNLGEDFCSWSWSVTPDLPNRGRRFDFNYILRGEYR